MAAVLAGACAPHPGPPNTTTTTTTTTTTVPGPTALTDVAQVSSTGNHTCAVTIGGSVLCFGRNQFGQTGNATNAGTNAANPTPTVVAGLSGIESVAAGSSHTCALTSGGTVVCWGSNIAGELGPNAAISGTAANPTPVAVTGLSGVTALSAGVFHTCALASDGSVFCWGSNVGRRLGSGVVGGTATPTRVTGLGPVTSISTNGQGHTCARMTDGTAVCWGVNFYGQLGSSTGNGTSTGSLATPVAGLTGLVATAAGWNHSCALKADATLVCSGLNSTGQLGTATNNGVLTANPTPTPVPGLSGVASVSAGLAHTCAVRTDDSVWCFGENGFGELGATTNVGVAFAANPAPAPVPGLTGVASVAAANKHTCALKSDRTIACFGSNQYGQLGNPANSGTTAANPTPLPVSAAT
jgi:alpha-tubulin suppressor-like RCC1 family protein